MAAMLEEPNNKRYLHKNKIYFPKEIILFFRSSDMAAVNTHYGYWFFFTVEAFSFIGQKKKKKKYV